MPSLPSEVEIAIIGGGPAGLMAAEVCAEVGFKPHIFERMPTPARKFLMAGKSGLNITHGEPLEKFLTRYSEGSEEIKLAIKAFTPSDMRVWADELGTETFVGSSGRVFPKVMKASPLLRAWLKKLENLGTTLHTRCHWQGWNDGALHFNTSEAPQYVKAKATILALGGSSWPKLGADGSWFPQLQQHGANTTEFQPSNCGFEVNWSDHFKERNAGEPIKNTILSFGPDQVQGDFVISGYGLEGSAIYALSSHIRRAITSSAQPAVLTLDLTPDRSLERLRASLSKPKGKKSFSTHLKRTTGLSGVKAALIRECLDETTRNDPALLAAAIKALPIQLEAPRPIEEAISTAGGVMWNSVDKDLMLKAIPGTFCAGEMLDWDAPTGGYLLTACMAQGRQAAHGAIKYLKSNS
ncbi:TIGR03862 family flavoprotein [Kordiimonas sp. SCSIO 12603]|uniref:TIGR03862 family flavoprotein n=1 Tax=Kordiimonas sp. SCSIO 12603 TaxID=2829596 RepID=UPI002106D4FE|nr:TIGR03862 family flavoprotein [Kordiimonas sp. SCSIO 12603]UTW60303.1 TIGR03862 family flavoprotein [Kordiimonas sp. SCSIO 12603]